MNAQQIFEHISGEKKFSKTDIPDLLQLTEKFPASSLYALLYLETVHNFDSVNFDSELQNHAFKVNDRVRLYHLIQEESDVYEVIEESFSEESEEIEFTKEEIIEPETSNLEVEIHEKAVIEEVSTVEVQVIKEEKLIEVEEEIIETTEVEIKEEIGIEVKAEKPINVESIKVENVAITVPRSFNAWLKSDANVSENVVIKTIEENKATVSSEIKIQEKTTVKSNKQDLIDRFIELNPKISRTSSQTETNTKKKETIKKRNEEGIPVSETLAKIFESQGNFPKAIHVYHQLILKFPERKNDFTPRIALLKEKMENK